jgi:hypothetical protein
MLEHSHEAQTCEIAYAAWSGYDSPLRHRHTVASCAIGEHRIFWLVEAGDAQAALRQLPEWLAERTVVREVSEVTIP